MKETLQQTGAAIQEVDADPKKEIVEADSKKETVEADQKERNSRRRSHTRKCSSSTCRRRSRGRS